MNRNVPRITSSFSAIALAVGLASCAQTTFSGHTAKSDGVMFAYNLTPTATPHHYDVALELQDAATGQAIDDAGVALNMFGPGMSGDGLVSMHRNAQSHTPTYVANIDLPTAATYTLTFQVNRRAPAPSAQATFSTARPTG